MSRAFASSRLAVPLLVVVATTLATVPAPAQARDVPYLAGRVNDLADVLSAPAEERIEGRLAELEEATGAQVAVLTIPSLEGDSVEDYSLRVAETWKLGRGKFDDGALLLIVRDDRKMRLEVGYGLEPTLTDALSGRILDDILRPSFRAGDFDGGVEKAVDAIVRLVEGETNVLPRPEKGGRPTGDLPGRVFGFLIFAFVVGLFSLQAIATKGCAGWFLYFFLMPFWLVFPLFMLGRVIGLALFVGWVIGFPILRLIFKPWTRGGGRGGGFWGGLGSGGWTWSSGSGGWGGGGGGFSGGFSGGGGSFGGGGASGGW